MHANEQAQTTDGKRSGRAPARTQAPGGVPAQLRALQASAGNAAVLQMLRQAGHSWAAQEQHQHGAGCGHQQTEQPAVQRSSAVHDVLRTSGRPLDAATRTDMEGRLGADFSDVRIHSDSAAKASAAEVGARAYTSGHHVVIGDGGADKHTLAHELTHVIQQRQGPVSGTDNGSGLNVSDPSDRFEREAEANATRVMRSAAPTTSAHSGDAAVQRALPQPAGSEEGVAVQRAFTGKPYVNYGPIHPTHDAGTLMHAEVHPGKTGGGSKPSTRPNWWPDAGSAASQATKTWFSNYMVQGHLLNHNIGGPGDDMKNLTPLVKSANSTHSKKVEQDIKGYVDKNYVVEYEVRVDYSNSPSASDLKAPAGIQNEIDTDYAHHLAHAIEVEYSVYDLTGNERDVQALDNKNQSWWIGNDAL
ncbi:MULTISPECIES: DUF4157 domain-containing protein [unclassified Streptomyces]|uniref:eCIS core domain-containing protein n=1 Tax=unclassified Streptomyces TaxID=2593676 RepID=UPI003807483C